jgi:two-component sensor histidine kinase
MRNIILIVCFLHALLGYTQENGDLYLEKAQLFLDNENDSVLIYSKKAKNIFSKKNNPLGIVKSIEMEGFYHLYIKNNYDEAQKKFLECLELCEKHKLNYHKNIYHSLGRVFHFSDNYPKAKEYFKKAYELAQTEKDSLLIAKGLASLATINFREDNFGEAEKLFLEALRYPSDKKLKNAIYSNFANMKIGEKKYQEAIKYAVKAIEFNPIKGGDPVDYSRLLDAKNEAKDFTGIDTILRNAKMMFEKASSLREKTIVLASISVTHYNLGQYKQAAEDKDLYIDLFYDLKSQERDEVIYEMETKYQTDKKEEELQKKIKEKNQLLYFTILSGFIILILSYLVYLNIKQKQKVNKQKAQLEILVDEKNTLLKETHHRVKNSFQIVSSLLYLQSENIHDKEAALAVKEAQNRVKSMILIHQKLYSKDQLVGIDSKEYIEDLVNDIIENQSDNIENLTIIKNIESKIFSIDTITPIGLIINELITNVIKYAFPDKIKNPQLTVSFLKKEGNYELRVSDNGIGISNQNNPDSFGLKLIHSLAKKLKAAVSFENNNGTTVTLLISKFEELN